MQANYSANIGKTRNHSRPLIGSSLSVSSPQGSIDQASVFTIDFSRQSSAATAISLSVQDDQRLLRRHDGFYHPLRSHPVKNKFASRTNNTTDLFQNRNTLHTNYPSLTSTKNFNEKKLEQRRRYNANSASSPRQRPDLNPTSVETSQAAVSSRDLSEYPGIHFYPDPGNVPRRDRPIYGLPESQGRELSSAIAKFMSNMQPRSIAERIWETSTSFHSLNQIEASGKVEEPRDMVSQRLALLSNSQKCSAPIKVQRPKPRRGDEYDGLVLTDVPEISEVLSRDGDGSRIPSFTYAYRTVAQERKKQGIQEMKTKSHSYNSKAVQRKAARTQTIPVIVQELEIIASVTQPVLRRQPVYSYLRADSHGDKSETANELEKHSPSWKPSRSSFLNTASLQELAPMMRSESLRRKYLINKPRKRTLPPTHITPRHSSLGRRAYHLEALRHSHLGNSPLRQEVLPEDISSNCVSSTNSSTKARAPHNWSDLLLPGRRFSFERESSEVDSTKVRCKSQGAALLPDVRERSPPETDLSNVDSTQNNERENAQQPVSLSSKTESPPKLFSWTDLQLNENLDLIRPLPHLHYTLNDFEPLPIDPEHSSYPNEPRKCTWSSVSSPVPQRSRDGSAESSESFPFNRRLSAENRLYASSRPSFWEKQSATGKAFLQRVSRKGQGMVKGTEGEPSIDVSGRGALGVRRKTKAFAHSITNDLGSTHRELRFAVGAFGERLETQGNKIDGRALVAAGRQYERLANFEKEMARGLHDLALKTDFDSIYTLARKVDLISTRRSDKAEVMQSVGALMQEEGVRRHEAERACGFSSDIDF